MSPIGIGEFEKIILKFHKTIVLWLKEYKDKSTWMGAIGIEELNKVQQIWGSGIPNKGMIRAWVRVARSEVKFRIWRVEFSQIWK